jgi:hypothetical protein
MLTPGRDSNRSELKVGLAWGLFLVVLGMPSLIGGGWLLLVGGLAVAALGLVQAVRALVWLRRVSPPESGP